eukprot:CAMPEP_0117435634 /NCGR_PEP_ID=MMETSP0759-20121206/583_1 /TAXON_ID=63605 /ORGANISM="Percolomonas cosmopolitus, Strain WS" /LENGTH=97 /DNA_ID=CAMNT_0005227189 /DNA_START=46 /DNA_END=339 /DNA_ORIENTATION=-
MGCTPSKQKSIQAIRRMQNSDDFFLGLQEYRFGEPSTSPKEEQTHPHHQEHSGEYSAYSLSDLQSDYKFYQNRFPTLSYEKYIRSHGKERLVEVLEI